MAKFSSKTRRDEVAIFAASGGEAVHGESASHLVAAIAGVQINMDPDGKGAGVYGESRGAGAGIVGINRVVSDPGAGGPGGPGGPAGYFMSEQMEGVFAETNSLTRAAIAGVQNNPDSTGAAIYGRHAGGLAAWFEGNVMVLNGDVSFTGSDFAEHFTIKDAVLAEPGTVMVLDGAGELVPCAAPYDKKVVGVVAGAGTFRTGIIMDKQAHLAVRREPVALVGKVFCKADAGYGPIEAGDLLTSSATCGHAMKACDPVRAFGAVLGKAMAPLAHGTGLIPILISLQ